MQAAPRISLQGFRREICIQAGVGGTGSYYPFESRRIVGGRQGIGIVEVYLILPRPFLMVAGLWNYTHLLQRKADFPSYVLAFVLRGNVHVSGCIKWNFGWKP